MAIDFRAFDKTLCLGDRACCFGLFLAAWLSAGCEPVSGAESAIRGTDGGKTISAQSPVASAFPGQALTANPGGLADPKQAALRRAFIAARQAEGATDARYHFRKSGNGALVSRSDDPHLALRIDDAGVTIGDSDGWQPRLQATDVRCGSRAMAVHLGPPLPGSDPHQVVRKGVAGGKEIREWYLNGPLGLEHGWDLIASPCDAGDKLTLVVSVEGASASGDDPVSLSSSAGYVVARYGDVHVEDAAGRDVSVAMRAEDPKHIAIEVPLADIDWPLRIDPFLSSEQYKLEGVGSNAHFGSAVAMSGTTAVVGASQDSELGRASAGAAYVFELQVAQITPFWKPVQKLFIRDATGPTGFGSAVVLDGDTIAVGAPLAGTVYTFRRTANGWREQQRMGGGPQGFGASLALTSERLAVGGGLDGAGQHFVSTYSRAGDFWLEDRGLYPPLGAPSYFGSGVALAGDMLVVGAAEASGNSEQGAVYTYARSASDWYLQQELKAYDGAVGDNFGAAVALSGNSLAVGATWHSGTGLPAAVYVFRLVDSAWAEPTKLTAGNDVLGTLFGSALAFADARLIVGAPLEGGGAAYTFQQTETTWSVPTRVTGNGKFGTAVAVAGAVAFASSPEDSAGALTFCGSVYQLPAGKLLGLEGSQASAHLGASVAVSGSLAVVGVPGALPSGLAYVFRREGNAWRADQPLWARVASVGEYYGGFGTSVSIEGDTIVVGNAPPFANDTTGHVFTRTPSGWIEQQVLVGGIPDIIAQTVATAIDGDVVLLGDAAAQIGFEEGRGRVHVFTRHGATWSEPQLITISTGTWFDGFGAAVSIDGATALMAAPNEDGTGVVRVYTRSGDTWMEGPRLVASDSLSGDQFGTSVSISGDTAAIGAPGRDVNGLGDQGAVYVYTRSGTNWSFRQQLLAPDGQAGGRFGTAVTLHDEAVVIGAPGHDVSGDLDQGATYVFTRAGSSFWTHAATLTSAAGAAGDGFGRSVSFDGRTVIVGAPAADFSNADGTVADPGAAYLFELTFLAGMQCSDGSQCAPGYACVQGVCCTSSCTELCGACSVAAGGQRNGFCSPLPRGTEPSGCGAFRCDGASISCPVDCESDDDCVGERYCDAAGECVPSQTAGAECGPEYCREPGCARCGASLCSDGICCEHACDEPCDTCRKSDGASVDGQCGFRKARSAGEPSCAGGLLCDGTSETCPEVCRADADCQTSHYCDTESGDCELRQDVGESCSRMAACRSGLACIDGYCCSSDCEEQCEACDVAGAEGTCTPVSGAPHGARPACGASDPDCAGRCDGQKRDGCAFPDLTRSCGSPSCESGVFTDQVCSGQGDCVDATAERCAPFGCNGDRAACSESCSSDAECATGAECNVETAQCAFTGNTCVDAFTSQAPSGVRTDCSPYRCAAGVCQEKCVRDGDCTEGYDCENHECEASSVRAAEAAPDAGPSDGPLDDDDGVDEGDCGCVVPGMGRTENTASRWLVLVLLLCIAARARGLRGPL